MVVELMLIALILVLCIIADKFSGKFGMPALILFIGIGMLFGSDGIVKIPFDNFAVTEQICTIALGFIMFYGGFNTKWKGGKAGCSQIIVIVNDRRISDRVSHYGILLCGIKISFRRGLPFGSSHFLYGCCECIFHFTKEKAEFKRRRGFPA